MAIQSSFHHFWHCSIIIIDMNLIFKYYSRFSSLAMSWYFFRFSLSFTFTLLSTVMSMPMIWRFLWVFFFCYSQSQSLDPVFLIRCCVWSGFQNLKVFLYYCFPGKPLVCLHGQTQLFEQFLTYEYFHPIMLSFLFLFFFFIWLICYIHSISSFSLQR